MEFLAIASSLIFVVSCIGLWKPSIVKQDGRKKIWITAIASLIIFSIVNPDKENTDANIGKEFLSDMTVSDSPLTSYNKQAVSIMLLKTQEAFIDMHIIKSEIKTGFHSLLNKDNIENYLDDKFGISLTLNGDYYRNLPSFYKTNFVELKVIKYNKTERKAIFEISFELTDGDRDNHKNTANVSNLRFDIEGDDFDLLKKDQTVKEFEDAVKREINTKNNLTNDQIIRVRE
ncbi:hypothetical protein SPONN_2278 [uncultured Candidatus Thioglobus sp.]|nr:hypothetical protein SPONN_2278 [uncultured Candidatus Thioglobus sp.]